MTGKADGSDLGYGEHVKESVVYQVIDWDTHFENFKSRGVDRCSFVCVPNKQHGAGFTFIMDQAEGDSIYGIFMLILGGCSQHTKPRKGWMTKDGREDSEPWTIETMARRWRRKPESVRRALSVLCSEEVGWIVAHVNGEVSDQYPHGICQNRKGNRKENKNLEHPSDVLPGAENNSGAEQALIVFPVVGRGAKTWNFDQGCLAELSSAFQSLDVLAESRKALAWLQANPGRRKTPGGMKRFLFGWMERAQNRGSSSPGHIESSQAYAARVSQKIERNSAHAGA